MENDADKPDYEVGYGKPPKDKQFTKGQSGNPGGRPKGSKSFKTLLEEEWREKIAVTVNGKTKRLSKKQLLVKGAVARAINDHDYKGLAALGAFDEPPPIDEPPHPMVITLKLEEDPEDNIGI